MVSDPFVSDAERLTAEHVRLMETIRIDIDHDEVIIRCADDRQAADMAHSVALWLADRIAALRRVLDAVPSAEQRADRAMRLLDQANRNIAARSEPSP